MRTANGSKTAFVSVRQITLDVVDGIEVSPPRYDKAERQYISADVFRHPAAKDIRVSLWVNVDGCPNMNVHVRLSDLESIVALAFLRASDLDR